MIWPPGARLLPDGALVVVAADPAALAARAADFLLATVRRATEHQGRAVLALSGGTTPARTYRRLARSLRASPGSLTLLQADERLVPSDDPRSNAALLRRCWADGSALQLMIPRWWRGERDAPSQALAAAYCLSLELHAPGGRHGVPALTAAVLGLGSDGHTASLFPGSAAARERSRWVVPVAPEPVIFSPPVARLTLTSPVLEAAQRLVFLVQGAGKAEIVAAVLQGGRDLPGARFRRHPGAVWFLDRQAAACLPL